MECPKTHHTFIFKQFRNEFKKESFEAFETNFMLTNDQIFQIGLYNDFL
jgi:hypothetical protein